MVMGGRVAVPKMERCEGFRTYLADASLAVRTDACR